MKKSIFSISSLCLLLGMAPLCGAPNWIWSSKKAGANDKVTFRTHFDIPSGGVSMAKLEFTCDNGAVALLNGKKVATNPDWQKATGRDLTDLVKVGSNVLIIKGKNEGGAAGLVARLSLKQKNGKVTWVESDGSWDVQVEGTGTWKPATVIAKYGAGPWGKALDGGGGSAPGPVAEKVETLPGFEAEKLYTVPKGSQGSWVAMTVDPKGNLITGDQYGGLYRVILPKGEGEVDVQKLNTKVEGAHGLCYVYGALYLLKNEQKGARGLYRLSDTNNDGQFDKEEFLREFKGGGEHGLHSIIPSPDGKSLHLVFGNHTDEPKNLDASRPAKAWKEDHLLPRMWDGNGHARGKLAPGGFILKTDPDAKKIEMIAYGFRNQFDAAFTRMVSCLFTMRTWSGIWARRGIVRRVSIMP